MVCSLLTVWSHVSGTPRQNPWLDKMSTMSDVELIQKFNAAWLDGDLETVLSCVADDIVYSTSGSGGAPVTTYRGRAEVAAVFAEHIGHDPQLTLGPVAAGHGRALCDWWYPMTADGTS